MDRKILSRARLREVLAYDPESGVFTWRKVNSNRAKIGRVAGIVNQYGHRRITVDGVRYVAHRLAWFYVYGEWPSEIDHINGERDDNRIANLRQCTRTENNRNKRRATRNKSGFKGVAPHGRRFTAQIMINYKKIHLGVFDDPRVAHAAYCDAATHYFGEFARFA